MTIRMIGSFGPITGAVHIGDYIVTYEHLVQFDTSTGGSGTYYNNDTSVTNLTFATTSKKTFEPVTIAEEIRLRWSITDGTGGIQVRMNDDAGHTLVRWKDSDNTFAYRAENDTFINSGYTGQGATMEMRINRLTSEYTFLVNDIELGSVTGKKPLNPMYCDIYCNPANGGADINLLPDPN